MVYCSIKFLLKCRFIGLVIQSQLAHPTPPCSLTRLLFFLATPSRNRILVPRTRDQPPAVETWSLNHWTTREVPRLIFLMCLITQSTLCNPMDCNPPGFSIHGDSPGNHTGMGCHALLQGIFPTQGLSPGLPHWMWILYHLNHQHLPLSEFIYISCPTGWPVYHLHEGRAVWVFFTSIFPTLRTLFVLDIPGTK